MFRFSPLPLAVVLLCAGASAVQAQDEVDLLLSPSYTLSGRSVGTADYADRVKIGLVNMSQDHPEVLAAQTALTSSGFEGESAKRARFPRFALATSSGKSSTFISADQTVSQRFTSVTASVRATLLDAGGISARVRSADANTAALEEALRTASQKVLLDGITAYLQVQRYDLKKRIAAKSTEVLDEMSRAEQRKVDLGAAGQSDARLAASRRAGAAARRQEFDALLIDATAKFEVYFKFRPAPGALPNMIVPRNWIPATQDEAMQIAEANSSEMAEQRARILRSQANVDAVKSSRFPTLDAVVSKTRDNRDLTVEPSRAALELNLNVGNGFDIQSRIRAAMVDVDAQEARLEQARANLSEFTTASYGRTQSSVDRVKQLTDAVSDSGLAYQSKRRLLGFGRETLTNVLDAQLEHYNLLLDLADAMFDQRIAEFRLARSTGRLLVDGNRDNAWINAIVSTSSTSTQDVFATNLQEQVCKGDTTACYGPQQTAQLPEIRNPVLRRTPTMFIPGQSYGVDITAPQN